MKVNFFFPVSTNEDIDGTLHTLSTQNNLIICIFQQISIYTHIFANFMK